MWAQGGVTDEDKLSRAQARTVIGRVLKMAGPFQIHPRPRQLIQLQILAEILLN